MSEGGGSLSMVPAAPNRSPPPGVTWFFRSSDAQACWFMMPALNRGRLRPRQACLVAAKYGETFKEEEDEVLQEAFR